MLASCGDSNCCVRVSPFLHYKLSLLETDALLYALVKNLTHDHLRKRSSYMSILENNVIFD